MSVYKYRIYCNTEGTNVVGFGLSAPTVCYNNNSHSVDLASVAQLDEITTETVKIKEEDIPTGGHYGCTVKTLNIDAGVDVMSDITFSFDYPVTVMSTLFITGPEHENDIFDVYLGPNTSIGTLSGNVSIGASTFDVDASVMNYAQIGYIITLDDGANADNVGQITNIDTVNNQITCTGTTTHSFLSTTPTIVKSTVYMVSNFEIGPAWQYSMGVDKIGGSYLPANTEIQIKYINKSASAKKLRAQINYLY